MAGAHSGSSPFIFSVATHMSSGREMEGGKPESMLETCAVVPDPPCCRYADSTGSVWLREAVGTTQLMTCSLISHRKVHLLTNVSQEEIIQLVRH